MSDSFCLKDYQKLDKIGSGTFGDVFKVRKEDTGEIFAAKISNRCYDLKDLEDKKNKDFKREIENISKISHPSILHFVGFSPTNFENDNKPVMITEFLPNGSLEDIIRSEKSSEPDPSWTSTKKLIALYGIVTAMAFLHFHDILHRDLKPENILLDDRLFPRIADFGLSKDESLLSSTVEIKGTPVYIAPEIWENNQYSKASDVYAFGFIVYEIITNERPFRNLTLYKLQNKVCKGDRPEIKKVPSPIYKELIESCWAKSPSDRPSFDQIRTLLKKDPAFITHDVNEDDFKYYVKKIDTSRKIFNTKKPSPIKLSFDRETEAFRPVHLQKKRILSNSQYNKLKKSSQNLVNEAITNPDKQFEVGKNLIEGSKGFMKDIDKGILYLKSSIEGLNIDAAEYYNRMLISGKIIPKNLDEAKNNLKSYKIQNDPKINVLLGLIERKQENYAEAIDIFYEICDVNAEASYQLGKMTYRGEGTDQDTELAKQYFQMAKKKGCTKVDSFYSKNKNKKAKVLDEKKRTDIVFLIDGCRPTFSIYSAFNNVIIPIIEKCKKKYPKVLFRFGSVIYKIKPITNKMAKQPSVSNRHDKLVYIDLTKDIDEIQNFFMKNKVFGASEKWASDWASGYEYIATKIHWNKKAKKVVLHFSNLPALGESFTLDSRLPEDLIAIPNFKLPDDSEMTNESIFSQIQSNEDSRFKKQIKSVAKQNIMFFCMNFNKLSLCSLKNVRNFYNKKDGKKFVIKDYFSKSPKVDQEELQKPIKNFIINSIQCCFNDENEEEEDDDDDDDDKNIFENDCNRKFEEDFRKFINSNKIQKKPATSPPPKRVTKKLGKTKKQTYSSDSDDDFDDDKGHSSAIIKKDQYKKANIKKKTASTPSIPSLSISDDDDEEEEEDDDDDRIGNRPRQQKQKHRNPFDFP